MENSYKYFKRDISWLSFNYRVLLEAEDETLPIYERIKFLSIYSSNLEEFYEIRVAEHRAVIMRKNFSEESADEAEETLAAIKVVKAHDKNWKITYAGNWHEELDGLLDDYSFLYGEEPTVAEQAKRRQDGRTSTVYVCCNPPVPNNFVFSPPIEGRWISWYVMAHGYDGFLRWAYDAWPADADRDARHGSWAAGDCYLVYPGGKSCIRFEKMREGIVDFEKVRVLRELAARSDNPQARELIGKLDRHLPVFLSEKDFDETKIAADVREGLQIINQLSDLLAD